MRAHHIEYVDARSKPAVLSWKQSEISHANDAAALLLQDTAAYAAVADIVTRALNERQTIEAEVAGQHWIALPLFDAGGAPELAFATTGSSADVPLLIHELGNNLRRFNELLHVLPNAVLTARPNGRIDFANMRWFRKTATPPETTRIDDAFWQAVDPRDSRGARDEWRAGVRGDDAFSSRFRVNLAGGDNRWHELRANPWTKHGRIIKWVVSVIDVHDAVLAQLRSEKLLVRLRLLADIGNVLGPAQDPETMLEGVVSTVARNLSANCQIEVTDDGWAEARTAPARGRKNMAKWAPSTRPAFVEFPSPAAGNPRSVIALPLEGSPAQPGLPAGVAILSRDAPHSPLSEEDYATFEVIVARTAAALALASQVQRTGRIAMQLQRSMLPASLPDIPGVTFDVCYRPAEEQTLVGGDWYDAFLLPRGKVAIMIGDVSGHGIEAAISMNRLRQTFRTVAMEIDDPGVVLSTVNRVAAADGEAMATAFYAVLDPMTYALQFAGAGHPPGYIVSPGGAITQLSSGGPPLSVTDDFAYPSNSTRIETGQAFVLCTDGLIEVEHDVVLGEQRLTSVLAAWSLGGFSRGAEALQTELLGRYHTRDDAAILIARFPAMRDATLTFAATAFDARRARAALDRFVAKSGLPLDRAEDLALAGSEAFANCVRHAYRGEAGSVTLTLHRDEREVCISVADCGAWLEAESPRLESGRGLLIMDQVTDSMNIDRGDAGTTVHLRARIDAPLSEAGRA